MPTFCPSLARRMDEDLPLLASITSEKQPQVIHQSVLRLCARCPLACLLGRGLATEPCLPVGAGHPSRVPLHMDSNSSSSVYRAFPARFRVGPWVSAGWPMFSFTSRSPPSSYLSPNCRGCGNLAAGPDLCHFDLCPCGIHASDGLIETCSYPYSAQSTEQHEKGWGLSIDTSSSRW